MTIKVGDRLPEGQLQEFIDVETEGCPLGPNTFSVGEIAKGKKIVVFHADDLNKPDVGANTVRQWIDERNVDMVTGMVASSVVLAASKVVEQGGKLTGTAAPSPSAVMSGEQPASPAPAEPTSTAPAAPVPAVAAAPACGPRSAPSPRPPAGPAARGQGRSRRAPVPTPERCP